MVDEVQNECFEVPKLGFGEELQLHIFRWLEPDKQHENQQEVVFPFHQIEISQERHPENMLPLKLRDILKPAILLTCMRVYRLAGFTKALALNITKSNWRLFNLNYIVYYLNQLLRTAISQWFQQF
jgi:hypothetical protein